MANKKKNSNYQTDKALAAKEAKEVAARKRKIKKIVIPIVAVLVAIAIIVGAVFAIGVPLGMLDYEPEATTHLAIQIDGYDGTIHIELYGNDAPESVKKFTDIYGKMTTLSQTSKDISARTFRSYKDGLLYFGSASADCGEKGIKGEFSSNGVENDIVFRKGVIAVARGEGKNSGGSQFFIVTENRTDLNGEYAAFARITSGMSLVEEILENIELDENGKILNPPKISKVESHDAHSH